MSTTEPAVERALRYAVAPLTEVNFRDAQATGDGSWLVEGYAAVFDERTTLYDGKFLRVTEEIDPHFFDAVLSRDPLVHLNYGHDMQSVVASTRASGVGGLLLEADERGLRFEARMNRMDPDAQRVAVKMDSEIVDQASFAFTIADEERTTTTLDDGREEDHYRLTVCGDLFDVCVCARGAYQQTVSQLRSYAAAIGRSSDDEGRARRSKQEGAETVVPEEPAGGDTHQHEAALLDMRRRLIIAKRRVSL